MAKFVTLSLQPRHNPVSFGDRAARLRGKAFPAIPSWNQS
jgi:hypothetical protein